MHAPVIITHGKFVPIRSAIFMHTYIFVY